MSRGFISPRLDQNTFPAVWEFHLQSAKFQLSTKVGSCENWIVKQARWKDACIDAGLLLMVLGSLIGLALNYLIAHGH
jgi:hypothetical protein